jgi:3'-phosphoadenosine 5'-phosphosulfate sulfotransferase (PAPS reductase)/FAD synthetase
LFQGNIDIAFQISEVVAMMNIEENKKGWALLSGGKDSTIAAVEMDMRNKLEGVIYIDTGIGLKETKEYVEGISSKFDWNLKVFSGYTSYDSYVLKHGFPTPSGHSQIMHILKLDAVRRFISWHRREIGSPPLLFSGVRRTESSRRSRWARRIQFYQGAYWDCPIFHYSDEKVWDLHYEYKIPINSAYGTIGKSGDCLCGAFGNLTEKKIIEKYYPYLSDHISHLEENTKSEKYGIWGNTDKPICSLNGKGQSEHLLCSECSMEHNK